MTVEAGMATLKQRDCKRLILFMGCSFVFLLGGKVNGNAEGGKTEQSCNALRSMARMHMALGNYAKAEPLAEQALSLAKTENVSDSQLSMCLLDMAWLCKDRGRFDDAEVMCKDGLELLEKARGKNHPYVAYTLRILGSIYQEQGRYSSAETVLNRALGVMLASHSSTDHIIAPFQVDIAKLLVARGKFTEAEFYYVQARALIDKSYGPNHLYTARVLGDVARLYTLQGRYSEAEILI
ncbi:MAG TPA: tetratricopeptide repeat protein, partial [Planctomycetes bacterium]|nr:tetratricopeptide repeat protein [Planctomycetota bacterium]